MSNKSNRGFKFFTGDVDVLAYGGTWIRHIAAKRFHFIEITNMDDACGRDNEGSPTYAVELSEVDLDLLSDKDIKSALQSCHVDDLDNDSAQVAGACFSYGQKAPLHSESTNNGLKGIAACKAESYCLTRDAQAYADAMDRPVNAIGSTAREYMTGDIHSAVLRGVSEGRPDAQLMLKLGC